MIDLSTEQRGIMAKKLQGFLQDEVQIDIGAFEAEDLLNFICNDLGAAFEEAAYNQAIADASNIIRQRTDILNEDIAALTKMPTPIR